jgi:hypothetical protein
VAHRDGRGTATPIPFSADVDLELGPLAKFAYSIPDSFTVRQIRDAVPSPDGKLLAFTALDKLYTLDLTCGQRCQPQRVSRGSAIVEQSPAWSPDGRFLAYATWDDAKGGDIYRVPSPASPGGNMPVTMASATPPEKLTSIPALYTRLQYTPAGDRIVFMHVASRARGTSTICRAPLKSEWISRMLAPRRRRVRHHDARGSRYSIGRRGTTLRHRRQRSRVLQYSGVLAPIISTAPIAGQSCASLARRFSRRPAIARSTWRDGSWSILHVQHARIGNESLTVNIGAGASAVPVRPGQTAANSADGHTTGDPSLPSATRSSATTWRSAIRSHGQRYARRRLDRISARHVRVCRSRLTSTFVSPAIARAVPSCCAARGSSR